MRSVAGWSRDIVVVINTEVTDGTDKIAEESGARVFREAWKGFIGQKNSALDKATQPWMLSLDADEEVTPELRAEMAKVIGQADACAAYEFPRCTFYCNRWIRHGDWYPDRVTRLWQRGRARWEGIEPHARLKVDGEIGRLRADLLHYSNETIDQQISKIGPYSNYFVAYRVQAGGHASLFDLTIRPLWRFLRGYIFKLGFLDGWPGYYIAWLSAFSTVTRYVKVREAQLQKTPP